MRAKRAVGLALALALALALVGGLAPVAGSADARTREPEVSAELSVAVASKVSASVSKTGAVATPKLRWYRCYEIAFCATAKVPLDYDRPRGRTTEIALVKIKATSKKRRIGSLFVNPGGPGGSATMFALMAPGVLSPRVLQRFDVIGMDPRGVGFSDPVRCFPSARQQTPALRGYVPQFPVTARQIKAWTASDRKLGRACSRSKGLATAMSTAQVARDLELMRRAVGDKKLSYLGFSYGSYLGQVYANMYPGRVRALAIDGVLDPQRWAGTSAALRKQSLEPRLRSGSGAWQALRTILVRCRQVGSRCAFTSNDPVAAFDRLAERLRTKPVVVTEDEERFTITYDAFIGLLLSALYDPSGWEIVVDLVASTYELVFPDPSSAAPERRTLSTRTLLAARQAATRTPRSGWEFPYENGREVMASVICTDSREKTKLRNYAGAYTRRADREAPHFGRAWMWTTSVCAGDAFRGEDEDAYRGPFNRRTSRPVLVVGSFHDPATNYAGAKAAHRLLPNSRLLSSDSWGHISYGTSTCVTRAVDDYLITGRARRSYGVCRGDDQPFQSDSDDAGEDDERSRLLHQVVRDANAPTITRW